MINIKKHCHNITRFYAFRDGQLGNPVADWFQIASGLLKVKYISDLFDELSIWCGTSIEYEDKKSDYHSKLVLGLTRFNFIWSGLEALLNSENVNPCPSFRGKINAANYTLSSNYLSRYKPPQYYEETVALLRANLARSNRFGNVNELFAPTPCCDKRVIGLKVVYSIRNLLAHGAYTFTEHPDWEPNHPRDMIIIGASSRIVLFSVQMLLLCTTINHNFKVAAINEEEFRGANSELYLKRMHLKSWKHS